MNPTFDFDNVSLPNCKRSLRKISIGFVLSIKKVIIIICCVTEHSTDYSFIATTNG